MQQQLVALNIQKEWSQNIYSEFILEFSVLWMPFTSWIVYVLLEKGQAIETDDNALLFRVHFGLDTGVIYFMKLYLMITNILDETYLLSFSKARNR